MMTIDIFKERLSEFRKRKNLSQKEMADKIGVTPTTFSAYEKGKNMPTAQILAKLSEEYGVSVDWLLGVENKNQQVKTYADLLKLLNDVFHAFSIKDFKHSKHEFQFIDDIEGDCYYCNGFKDAIDQLYSLFKMKCNGNINWDLYDTVFFSLCQQHEKEINYDIFTL